MKKEKQEQTDYAELLKQRKYDPNKPPPPEQIVFLIENKNIGTLQNFVTITGMQKSGKTTYMSAMIAAALTNTEKLGLRLRLPENKRRVSYWDTEQGDYDFHNTMLKINSFCGIDKLPAHFDSFNLREDEPKEILLMLDKYLELHHDCGLLLIDGILDLIESFNDEAESKRLVNKLKQITKKHDLLALLTLHKGKTTSTTLGHLGSMADRAAQSVLMVEKNKEKGTFVLKADYLRSADDFTPIEIYFNKAQHIWETTFYNPEQDTKVKKLQLKPHELDRSLHESNVLKIFMLKEIFDYKILVQNVSEYYARSRDWSRECVTHLIKEGLIFKTVDGYTNRQQAKLFLK